MYRKTLVAFGAAVLVAASTTTVPASAATKISNGVSCTKSGATTKVSGSSYKCAKNLLVKNSKLTWLSLDCLNTANTYVKALANLPKIKTATDATIAKLDVQVEKANKVIPEYQSKIETITARLLVLKADIPNLTKNKKTIDSFTSAVRNYEAAIKAYATVGKQSDRSQKARAQALLQYTNSKSEIDTTLGMAKLICTKGF